jgi:hypothetical protein
VINEKYVTEKLSHYHHLHEFDSKIATLRCEIKNGVEDLVSMEEARARFLAKKKHKAPSQVKRHMFVYDYLHKLLIEFAGYE